MSMIKRKSISIICIIALVTSLFGMMPAANAFGATMIRIEVDGTCETGYVDDGAAFYYFETPVNGTTRVGVSSGCSSVMMYLSATSDFYNVIDEGQDTTVNLPAGKYYVKVDCEEDHECTKPFEISANFDPLDEYDAEPNNTMSTAIKMTSGTTYKGHVYDSYNDVDWYKLVVKDLSIVHFYLDSASQATAYMYDADGNWVDYITGCAPGLTSPRYGVNPGTYYICIQPAYQVDRNYSFSARIVERPTLAKIKSVTATGIGKAKITWTKSKYAEGYYLYRLSDKNGYWSRIATLDADKRSYTDVMAPSLGNSCYYAIAGYRIDTKDPYNPYMEIFWDNNTNPELVKYTSKVPTPKNVKIAKLNGNTIKKSWQKVPDATGYKIYRKANDGKFKLVKTVKSGTTLSWKDTTVKKGTNYTYKVKAYYKDYNNKVYNSSYSSTVKAKLTGTIAKPTKVKAKKYSSYNKVSWGKVRTATGYKIYRKVGNGKYKLVKTTTSASTLTYKDKNVKSGKKYTYKVKAYYKNYTYNSSKGKYTSKIVDSKYSKIASVKR